jgi:predicted ATPase/DNA-binding CsgD family transcriptional regulator/DNA-binding XRE family transcriptional regulator
MGVRDARGRFADRLRRYRESAGLTQEELAERAGLTTKAISALERGERRRPYPNTVRAIADALQLGDEGRAALIEAIPSRAAVADDGNQRASGPGIAAALPPEASRLLGREEELEILREQLLAPEVRLVTVVGPGGVGKTRLATAVGRSLLDDAAFPDGVRFVDLSVAAEPSAVAAALARAFGASDATGASFTAVESALGARQLLVVLDNFEQVLTAAADVGRLIAASPGATFLVTSREPLRLRWERTLPLMPLALPDPKHLPPPDALARVPAVALFVERARASAPTFAVTSANAAPIAELCVRLDGLPLAIELVAARAAQLGPAATLDRLARRLPVPGPSMRDAPARQRSLQATLEWSLDLLEEGERRLFRRLAVFTGGWSVDAAEAVAGSAGSDVLDGLTSLADKSLIVVQPAGMDVEPSGEARFRMLDTARAVALDLLDASNESADARLAHARFYASFAEDVSAQLQGPSQAAAVRRLEREEDNFRHALGWARSSGREDALEEGLRLVGALAWYWFLHGYPAEARDWFDALLGGGAGAVDVEPGSASERVATLRAKALNAAGFRATDQGEYQVAATFHEQALAHWRRVHDVPGLVTSLHGVGDTALWLADADLAERSYQEGLALARSEGTPVDVALFAFHLGQLSWLVDRLDAAERYAQDALAVATSAGNTTWPPYALFVLASVGHERGDVAGAGSRYREAIELAWEHHDRLGVRMALPGLAALATLEGDPERALRLAGAASALEENAGIWAFPPIRERHERWLAAAQRVLDADRRAAAWAAGRAMTIDEMIAHALERPAPPTDRRARPSPTALSPREREVLDLLAAGSSNREIGEALFVTQHTAKYHVASLFNKLGATNRAEAVSRAIALGVLTPPAD